MSPALKWNNPPAGTNSFALTLFDSSAKTQGGWTHWIAINIPAATRALAKGAGTANTGVLTSGLLSTASVGGVTMDSDVSMSGGADQSGSTPLNTAPSMATASQTMTQFSPNGEMQTLTLTAADGNGTANQQYDATASASTLPADTSQTGDATTLPAGASPTSGATTLLTAAQSQAPLPAGTTQLRSDSGMVGYSGACLPKGKSHVYTFTLYALDVEKINISPLATPAAVNAVVRKHNLGKATLTVKSAF